MCDSTMYSPVEGGFGNLSLDSAMTPKEETVDSEEIEAERAVRELTVRKIAVWDFVSSFERHRLPSEISPDLFASIDIRQQNRDPSEWERPDDLMGTLMQWWTYDDKQNKWVNSLRSPDERAIYFWQKLARLFEKEFDKYDHPEEDLEPDTEQSANNLRRLEKAFQDDWRDRSISPDIMTTRNDLREAFLNAHRAFVRALNEICQRGRQGRVSLYDNLIANPPTIYKPFGIGFLEQLAKVQAPVLPNLREDLEKFHSLLLELQAPTDYLATLTALLEGITPKTPSSSTGSTFRPNPPSSDDDNNPPGPPTARPRATQPEEPTGKKRPAAQAAGRRGRPKRGAA